MRVSSFTGITAVCSLVASSFALPHLSSRSQTNVTDIPYTLPQFSRNRTHRAAEVAKRSAAFGYGPGTGGGPWSPIGSLGLEYVNNDSNITDDSLDTQSGVILADQTLAESNVNLLQDLKTVEDYTQLYADNNWANSSAPTGVAPGILTNYTSDLLFSMQRLSFSPFLLRRLDPTADKVPFQVDASIVTALAGHGLEDLFVEGRLFYADYRSLQNVQRNNASMYSANTEALFYISPSSGDFLPLAIRTNANNLSLIYTPHDTAEDWLLAKMMFNVDDFIMEAFHHLANTHYVTEIVYEAAIKTLSVDHPILPILARAMYGAFGIRPLALATLFEPGEAVDSFTPFTGIAIQNLTSDFYFSGYAGAVRNNYFLTNLERRGLLNAATGPPLKSFPFYEDAAPIHAAQRQFMHSFVYSYYLTDEDLQNDNELQAWLAEANGPAEIIDFPTQSTLRTRDALVDLLTHFVHLATSAHHAVNLNQVVTASAVLPLNPTAMYRPIPVTKGATDIAAYLPPLNDSIGIIELGADFARPLLAKGPRAMVHLFDNNATLSRMNSEVRVANEEFKKEMRARSKVVAGRTFDSNGLSQGMPFVWQALDPETMLISTTI